MLPMIAEFIPESLMKLGTVFNGLVAFEKVISIPSTEACANKLPRVVLSSCCQVVVVLFVVRFERPLSEL